MLLDKVDALDVEWTLPGWTVPAELEEFATLALAKLF